MFFFFFFFILNALLIYAQKKKEIKGCEGEYISFWTVIVAFWVIWDLIWSWVSAATVSAGYWFVKVSHFSTNWFFSFIFPLNPATKNFCLQLYGHLELERISVYLTVSYKLFGLENGFDDLLFICFSILLGIYNVR